jgi:hypothetical protein
VLVYDAARQRVVMFGGRSGTTTLGDTWEWDGASWTQMFPAHSPAPRFDAVAAYDAKRQRIVLFGGQTLNPATQDTWEYDGVDWTQRAPTTVPPARRGAAAAYDANRGRVILFGGTNGTTALNDTWEWTGTNWLAVTTTGTPAARFGARMAFDSTNQYVVMFGGSTGDTHTYTLVGTTWTDRGSTAGPSTGDEANGMAFHAERGRVVVWGGVAGSSFEWNGTTWATISGSTPTTPPSARAGALFDYDTSARTLRLYGGDWFNPPNMDNTYTNVYSYNGSGYALQASSGRTGDRTAAMAYDSVANKLVTFGGANGNPPAGTAVDTTWAWSAATGWRS